jgi:hypothetical protein
MNSRNEGKSFNGTLGAREGAIAALDFQQGDNSLSALQLPWLLTVSGLLLIN